MTITKEQALYKMARAQEIVDKVSNGTVKTLSLVDKINVMEELREIRKDLIEWRKENPHG